MNPKFIVVDLFCGAGGTTTGFVMTGGKALVAACVNHDFKAIKSHWINNPEVEHFEEDITKLYGYTRHGILFQSPEFLRLKKVVELYQAFYPKAKLILWASLECTNFSKAKGGQARDADSRTLADHLPYYVKALNPDYVQIENVVEFKAWGPMRIKPLKVHADRTDLTVMKNKKGVLVYGWEPISKKNGQEFERWCKVIDAHGYRNEWEELNSADFGAFTSRNRLFGIFARPGLPIVWPKPTHISPKKLKTKKAKEQASVFAMLNGHEETPLKKWKAVKEVLDFDDEGASIFNRKKPLSNKTLARIYAGLIKYVAEGQTDFLSKNFSGRPKGKVISTEGPCGTLTTFGGPNLIKTTPFIQKYYTGKPEDMVTSVEDPAATIRTKDGQALVTPICLLKYNSMDKNGKHTPPSLESPAPTIPCGGRLGIISACYLSAYYGNGDNVSSVETPCPVIPTKDRFVLVQPKYFINREFKSITQSSVEEPAGTLLTVPKMDLVGAYPFIMPTNYDNGPRSIEEPVGPILASRRHTYIVNPSHGGCSTSTEMPCPVIIARQDKAPLYLVQAEAGNFSIPVYDEDCEEMVAIKMFMVWHGLVDIKMRMLKVIELLQIQGFPADTHLEGNQSDQKKQIGNSVVPLVVMAWTLALDEELETLQNAA